VSGAPGDAGLVRALGVWGLAASIVNITIGGGIFRLPAAPELAGTLGTAAPLAYLLCALAMAFIVLCFAEAGSRVTLTGGPYAYVERAFGSVAGFALGWMLWLVGTFATAAVATVFADAVQRLVPALAGTGMRAAVLGAVFAVVTLINVRGVTFGVRLNIASTIAKLLPIAILIVLGLPHIQGANVAITEMPAVGDVTRASVLLIFAFAGIESALVPSGEVRDAPRTVPRAVFLALAIVTVVYLLVQFVAQGVLGSSLVGRPSPLADAAEVVMGPVGATMLGVGIIVSTFGYLCGMILAIPRALFAFGRDGFMPRALGGVHRTYRTPWIAIIVQSVIALALALSGEFERLAIMANLAVLLVYLGCAAAAWKLRRLGVRDEGAAVRPLPGAALGPPLAAIIVLLLLSSVTRSEWMGAALFVGIGLLVWFFAHLRRRSGASGA
jgi:APA family basic amino acid/polyamine antiporter